MPIPPGLAVEPDGLAIDLAANRVYWTNFEGELEGGVYARAAGAIGWFDLSSGLAGLLPIPAALIKSVVRPTVTSSRAGVAKLKVAAKGRARRALRRADRAKVKATIEFVATEGGNASALRLSTLRRRPRHQRSRLSAMDDDFRLQIDLGDDGIAGNLADLLRSNDLATELRVDLKDALIVSHEGERIFVYAGTREPLDFVRGEVAKSAESRGWDVEFDLRHWHSAAEEWEDADAPLPSTEAEKEAEHEQLMATEDAETAERGGLAEFEVRVEFPSHTEAREFAEKLEAEGLEPVRRWRYMVVGAADEDAAKALAERIRAEAPADSKVTTEGSLAVAWAERPVNPFFFLGGLAG